MEYQDAWDVMATLEDTKIEDFSHTDEIHVLGQLFDVLFPYSRKADLQVCQFFIRQENILVTAIGAGGASLLYLSLYLSLFL